MIQTLHQPLPEEESHPEVQDVLREPVKAFGHTNVRDVQDQAHEDEDAQEDAPSGRIVAGRYELLSVLGRGGASTVYRALHTFTHRPVALKLLSLHHARDRDLVERFLREARAATALVHHNTVEVLDMGVDTDGEVYLAMELLEGETLFEVIERERPMGPTRLAELILPIIDVLASAHRMGIVHRDIKPENVMIAKESGGADRPVLLDFGIAKVREVTRRTENGVILGTPYYMSPEQLGGERDVGPPSDVWSMGVLLYEALAGELPFASSSLPALFMSITTNQREPLRARMPAISEGWSSIVERALASAPGDRFADASELALAIRAELAGPTPLVARHPVGETIAPPPHSHPPPSAPRARWRWAVAAAVVLLLAAALWTTLGAGASSPTSVDALRDIVEVTAPAAATLDPTPATVPAEPSIGVTPSEIVPLLEARELPRPSETSRATGAPPVAERPAMPRERAAPRAPVPPSEGHVLPADEPTAAPRGLPEMATEW